MTQINTLDCRSGAFAGRHTPVARNSATFSMQSRRVLLLWLDNYDPAAGEALMAE